MPLGAPSPVGLDYYVDPEWLAQRGAVTLTVQRPTPACWSGAPRRRPGGSTSRRRGAAPRGELLRVSADSAWSPRAAGRDDTRLLGVRLRDELPAPAGGDRLPAHTRRSNARSRTRCCGWRARAATRSSPAGRRCSRPIPSSAVASAPIATPSWRAAIGPIDADRRVRRARVAWCTTVTRHGATVVLVNNPESALLRDQYADGPYYRSYLDFLAGVAARQPNTALPTISARRCRSRTSTTGTTSPTSARSRSDRSSPRCCSRCSAARTRPRHR